jgi:hypothetical protein
MVFRITSIGKCLFGRIYWKLDYLDQEGNGGIILKQILRKQD